MSDAADWKLMDDSANVENRNAGNGGDVVKHTVYLTVLRYLLARDPWRKGLLLRECHAGRGVYRIPDGDSRSRLLSCLYSGLSVAGPVLLRDAQRSALSALGCWLSGGEGLHWYAGSALINAIELSNIQSSPHKLEVYEWLPETRQILRSVLDAALPESQIVSVLPGGKQAAEFDGEAYIERNVRNWGRQNVVLLDPFAMWREPADQLKRNRYGAIVEGLVHRGPDAPSLILFWTWGRAFLSADGDRKSVV